VTHDENEVGVEYKTFKRM